MPKVSSSGRLKVHLMIYEINSSSVFRKKRSDPYLIHNKMSEYAKDGFGFKLVIGYSKPTHKDKQ